MFNKNEYENAKVLALRANEAYYDRDDPMMSDGEYDALMASIKEYEAAHPEDITATSPTQFVGGEAMFSKYTHKKPMLSLQDVFDTDAIKSFCAKFPADTRYCVEPKIDGLSMAAIYKNGILTTAVTRGDGRVGEIVTDNAMYIKGLPHEIEAAPLYPVPAELTVRCEVYLPVSRFDAINAEKEARGKKLFANPRNAAAGLLRTKDTNAMKDAGLECFVFNVESIVLNNPDTPDCYKTYTAFHYESLWALRHWGFQTVFCNLADNADKAIKYIEEIGNNKPSEYWIDGAVVKIDDLRLREETGNTSKVPKWAIAYKYTPEEVETTILNITLQVGRTGRITPVAEFTPVMIGGSVVARATLNNQRFINDMGVNIGDVVTVHKAAEIIPEITKVVKHNSDTPYIINANRCPVCGGEITVSDDGMTVECQNPDCAAKIAKHIEFVASRDVFDIRGLAESTIEKLLDAGLISDFIDVYNLKDKPDELAAVLGSAIVAEKLLASIEASKNAPFPRVIKSLGIKGVGRHVGDILEGMVPDVSSIHSLTLEELTSALGTVTGSAVYAFFSNEDNMAMIERMANAGINMNAAVKTVIQSSITGKTFVITGTLPTMARNEAQAYIEAHGGKVSGSVSKKTDFLLAGENAGSKLEKATTLGVKIISEAELMNM